MKINRYARVSILIIGSGVSLAIICAIAAIIMVIFAPEFTQRIFFANAEINAGYLATVGMITGFLMGTFIMAFIMASAAIAHWFCYHWRLNIPH